MCQILYESYKFLNVIIISRLPPIVDSAHLVCIHMQTPMVDHMAETVYLFSIKFAFLFLEIELELADLLKYKRKMFLVLIYRITVHEQIIEIGMQEYAIKSRKIIVIMRWNVAGALQSPICIVWLTYVPYIVANALLCMSSGTV